MSELLLSKISVFDPFLENLYLKVVEIGRKASRAKNLADEIENRFNRESVIPITVRAIGMLTRGALDFLGSEKRPSKFKFLAHNLKSLLGVISLRASLVETYLQKENYGEVKNSLTDMEKASSRSREMITAAGIKAAEGMREEDVIVTESIETKLKGLIESSSEMAMSKKRGDVGLYINVNPMTIRRYVSDLRQVIMNLISNAYEAMAGKVYEDGGPSLKVFSDILEQKRLRIEIEDNGPGMTQEVAERIFEKGFSTKEEKGDKGLGLYYCKNIMEKIGGSLSVKSIPGKTIFILEIPLEKIQ